MILAEHQALNTVTPAYDVEYRWFAGPAYATLATTGVRAVFTAWTAPDTGLPGTWTEITTKVSFAGKLTRTWSGAVLDWTLDVRGLNYDATLLAEGNAIACWQRLHRPTGTDSAPAGWQAWTLRCVGLLSKRQDKDNYQHGHAWQATISSHARLLSAINAPRLTAGKIRLTEGAAATASPALAQTALEADQGEFTGGSANVSAGNVVDGSRNTVYISDAMPTATREVANTHSPTEIMLTPLAGWSAASNWWVEFVGGANGLEIILGAYSGGTYTYVTVSGNWGNPPQGDYCIICPNRQMFELYTGGGNGGVAQIIDLSEYATLPANWLADGMIRLQARGGSGSGSGDVVAWSADGATRDYHNQYTTFFAGPTLNTTNMVAGHSMIRDDTLPSPPRWKDNPNPSPGANSLGVDAAWVKVELPDNVCNTLDEVSSSTDPIRLNNYRSWLATDASQGIIANKVFTWQYRDANGLHGISWVVAPVSPIPAGTRCYPYVDSLAQTGYPVTATHIRRRKQPAIKHYKVYWSPYGSVRDFTQTGWETDYYPTFHETQENTQTLRLSDRLGWDANLNGDALPYRWVRSIMYLIYAMTDDGRAKVNEIEADIDQMALDATGLPDIDGTESWRLAQWLFTTWADLASGDFTAAAGASGHKLGNHALAITPVAQVLASLARATGCLVEYDVTGGVTWRPDPWWPFNLALSPLLYAFAAADVRGEVSATQNTPDVDYVILNALSLEDGDPHTVRYVYPQPYGASEPPVAAMVTEINDLVLSRDADAPLVAQSELEKMLVGARTATLTVKGVGEWCAPGQRVALTWDLNADGTAETTIWLVQQVTTTTEQRDGVKALRTDLSLRGFRGDSAPRV